MSLRYARGGVTQLALAEEYGVDRTAVCMILSGARWAS